MKVIVEHDVPRPRVFAVIHPDYENTNLVVGLEITTKWGEPVFRVEVDVRWLRPRPHVLDVLWPDKSPGRPCCFEWRYRGGD